MGIGAFTLLFYTLGTTTKRLRFVWTYGKEMA